MAAGCAPSGAPGEVLPCPSQLLGGSWCCLPAWDLLSPQPLLPLPASSVACAFLSLPLPLLLVAGGPNPAQGDLRPLPDLYVQGLCFPVRAILCLGATLRSTAAPYRGPWGCRGLCSLAPTCAVSRVRNPPHAHGHPSPSLVFAQCSLLPSPQQPRPQPHWTGLASRYPPVTAKLLLLTHRAA